MPRPSFARAFNWQAFENSVLEVFTIALNELGAARQLQQGEEPLNLALYRKCLAVHLRLLRLKKSIPFVIDFDSTNQPEPDDTTESRRLKKRPDFSCALTDEHAIDSQKSQVRYTIECKRLGAPSGTWVFTKNYAEHGMLRFRHSAHSYAKGTISAAMIGYIQNTPHATLLKQVNSHATALQLPKLSRVANKLVPKSVARLSQAPVIREFDTVPIQLRHLWLDLRHCQFVPQMIIQAVAPIAKAPTAKVRPKASKKTSVAKAGKAVFKRSVRSTNAVRKAAGSKRRPR